MNNPNALYTGKLVRILLDEMGFDFSGYNENHLATIWNALRRMWKAGELKLAGDPDKGGGYKLVHKKSDIYTQIAEMTLNQEKKKK